MSSATDSPFVRFVLRKLQAETQYSSYRDARRSTAHHSFPTQQVLFDSKRYRTMAEENRRISTTPIPVPMPFGAAGQLAAAAAPTPSPLSQATPIASTPAEAPSTTAAAQTAPVPAAEPIVEGINKDVAMTDVPTTEQAPSPAPIAMTSTSGASPAPPARTGTPLRTNGQQQESSSRANSQHPDSGFTMPTEAPPHGAPVRQYLNSRVTGALLEGMKQIAKEQPSDPLRVLGEFLLQRSKEIEQST
ncbi:hypothetical protein PG995_000914 [Apiospora arundinis]